MFDERWLRPGGVVPVDIPTTGELIREIQRLRGLLPEEAKWRKMTVAPTDKTILGVVDGSVRLIRWGKTSHVPLYGWCLADQGAEDFDICEPTLWQPLPDCSPQQRHDAPQQEKP